MSKKKEKWGPWLRQNEILRVFREFGAASQVGLRRFEQFARDSVSEESTKQCWDGGFSVGERELETACDVRGRGPLWSKGPVEAASQVGPRRFEEFGWDSVSEESISQRRDAAFFGWGEEIGKRVRCEGSGTLVVASPSCRAVLGSFSFSFIDCIADSTNFLGIPQPKGSRNDAGTWRSPMGSAVGWFLKPHCKLACADSTNLPGIPFPRNPRSNAGTWRFPVGGRKLKAACHVKGCSLVVAFSPCRKVLGGFCSSFIDFISPRPCSLLYVRDAVANWPKTMKRGATCVDLR